MSRAPLSAILVLIAGICVLAIIAIAAAVPPNDQTNPSSRSAGTLGTLALYTWFSRLGLDVNRISGTFDLHSSDVVFVYDPTDPLDSSDVKTAMSFVRSGGDLVLSVTPDTLANAAPLLGDIGVDPALSVGPGNATVAQPFDSTDRVSSVPMGAGLTFSDQSPLVPMLVEAGHVVAGMVRVGTGRVYVLGDTQPLSNDGLRHGDSAFLALSLLQRARGGRIGFDEYHHGETNATSGAGAIFDGPVGLATALVALVVLFTIALNGRRLGKPATDGGSAAVPSATAYVSAMGQLFSRSRQRGPIAARYADELKRRLGGVTGVDWHLDDQSFCAAIAVTGDPGAPGLAALLSHARALASGRPEESELLRLARDVDACERHWMGAPVQ
ncbi:MAG TPA: DUF4350 domain-containing protein [Candidatus Dormibacteraeota bacterium]